MEPIDAGLFAVGGAGLAGLVWKIWTALHKTTTSDGAVTNTYDLLTDENKRLAEVLKGQHDLIEDLKAKIAKVEDEARKERLQCRGEMEALQIKIAGLEAILRIREHEDEMGRQGKIDRRCRGERRSKAE